MADPSTRILSITLPSGIAPAGGSDVLQLAIVADDQISGGKRAIQRTFRDANASDPGRIRTVEWEIWGDIGRSLFSQSGILAVDFVRDLETRWERRLLSAINETSVTLTGFDPPAATSGYFGGFRFGTNVFGGLTAPFTPSISGGDVIVFDEQAGYLFISRGRLITQVRLSDWTVIATQIMGANVRDAESWRGKGRVALGPTAPLQTRVGASVTGAVYEDTVATSPAQTVYANAVKRGSDRAWYIDASQSGDSFNFAGFTLDGFENLASPFQVGDPDIGINGIGPFGPLTFFGAEDGNYSFTDQGKPVPLSRALQAILSTLNGSQFADPGYGWLYYISVAGLRAVNLAGDDNPIGIGERMRGFTGHNGICTAIFSARGELWAVYETSAGDLYGYRGTFGPQTGGTGQPLFFPWFYAASQTCEAIFSSTTPNPDSQNLTIIRGAGTNMTYMTIAANGRDDLASTVYSTAGGTAWLTTFDKNPNTLKVLRLARTRTRSLTSGSSWAVAFGFDTSPTDPVGASYTTIATVTSNGFQTLTPVSAGAPLSSISGRTIKPRLVQVAAGSGASSTPPEIDGTLEVEYDERPDQIEEVEVAVNLTATGYSDSYIWDTLLALVGSSTTGPVKVQIPDDLPPGVSSASGGGQKYAMVAGVTARQDLKDGSIEAVTVRLQCWPAAEALSA